MKVVQVAYLLMKICFFVSSNNLTNLNLNLKCQHEQTSKSVISILHYNVQCLRNKLHQLDAFLFDKKFEVICLNEHWLNEDEIVCA